MDKTEYRAVIKHLYLKKSTATQVETELNEVPALENIYYWMNEFAAHLGRLIKVSSEEMIDKIYGIVREPRRIKIRF